MNNLDPNQYENDIAIIGMEGRFPGAANIQEFWENLKNGVESIIAFTPEELQASGVNPKLFSNPDYIKAGAPLDQAKYFDADFFGFQPKEAELMDPQHRLFLECAWSALEDAGYDAENYDGLIGVYGGVARNTYTLSILSACPDKLKSVAEYQAMIASEKDFPATRVAYKLNLKGPAVNIQTACSTSGVAIHMACQAIMAGDCDMALSGGGRVQVPTQAGYWYVEGGTMSPDGHCRAFDAEAKGMVRGSGMGFIVVKRFTDAVEDGDSIHAIIKGSAINNDGSAKVGFTAPSVSGQAAVIAEAQAIADVDADSISYVEAHGTGTPLGDPIEIAALTKAFRETTDRNGYCAVGSVKTNIGHLDAGATVASVIKTVLSLKHKMLPPSLNFHRPNPQIDFENSPFFVNTELREWKSDGVPRRAGISSFGLGGTNAHLILEESPRQATKSSSRPYHLFLLSAKKPTALESATQNLSSYFKKFSDTSLADAAYTLQTGRMKFNNRRFIVSSSMKETVELLDHPSGVMAGTLDNDKTECNIAFMFTGQGSQYINMGAGLYEAEPVFRSYIDRCSDLLRPLLEHDLRTILFPKKQDEDWAKQQLTQTAITQPALFSLEYSLAQVWRSWGISPNSMIGHSIGEYVAACLSGVFSLEDALKLVATRGRLMQALPAGTMLAVSLSEDELKPYLRSDVSLAVVNAKNACVVSGENEVITVLQNDLEENEITSRPLHTSHAFHSHMMDPILDEFSLVIKEIPLSPPRIPFTSNVTGEWISDSEATSPEYWVNHIRQTVRFHEGLKPILQQENIALLEVGPGRTLATLALQHQDRKPNQSVVTSIRHPKEETSDAAMLLSSLGRLWQAGCHIDWQAFYAGEKRQRISLPTYSFDRKRYWINCLNTQEQEPISNSTEEKTSADNISCDNKITSAINGDSQVQQVLQTILCDLSGLPAKDIDTDATFLQLGFDSLSLTQVCGRIKKELNVELTLRQVLDETPSFRALLEFLDTQRSDFSETVNEEVTPSTETKKQKGSENFGDEGTLNVGDQRLDLIQKEQELIQELDFIRKKISELQTDLVSNNEKESKDTENTQFPLTEGQLEIWAASQISHDNSCAFNLSNWIKMKGELDVALLQQAIEDLVSRHEALRINILADGSGQFVNPDQHISIRIIDTSKQSNQQRDQTIDSIRNDEMETPFDLSSDPLLRASLIKCKKSEFLLFITTHHIICDGWSTGVLLRDLAELYSARVEERSPQLQEAMQYSEFTAWNNQIRQSEEGKLSDKYWLNIYEDNVPVLELPTDRSRPAFKTYNASRVDMRIQRELSTRIKQEAAKQDVTLYAYLLAGFSALLCRLSNQNDVVVGVSAAGQGMVGDWDLVGHCVNFLPLRIKFAEKKNTIEYIKSVRQKVLNAFEHQKTSFGSLVKKINLPRDPSRNPLVSLIFNIAPSSHDIKLPGIDVEVGSNPRHYENFDLFTNIIDSDNGFELQWTYNTDLFDKETIQLRMDEFKVLLQAMVDNPQLPISHLPLLTQSESRQMLLEWNDTHFEYPANVCLHQLIEHQAEKEPHRTAVIFENHEISYSELNIKANQLAHQLRKLGAQSDTLVAIAIDRSIEMMVGLLGILKAGAAYLPVDPDYPRERVSFMLEDANVGILITQSHLLEFLPEFSNKVLCLDSEWTTISANSEVNPESVTTPDNLAYAIYTSGSTGKPKGVEIPHRAVVNFLCSMSQTPGFCNTDIMLAITTLSFDIAVLELFLPLVVGGKTVIVSRDEAMDGASLLSRLISAKATVMQATPASWRMLMSADWVKSTQLKVLCGGEAMDLELASELAKRSESVWNMYGPTETTIWSLCDKVDVSEGTISIGKPIGNTLVYVVDDNLQPVPRGVAGELCIGGHGIARGYLKRPELTSERFIDNPFNQQNGSKLYRTGDLARYLPDGRLECLGRIDNQVKVRGFRIELGEIENTLMEVDGLKQGAVVVREDVPGDARLVAYYVPDMHKQITTINIRKFLRSKLPDYMIPQHFVEIDTFPLTPNGKIDRKALPTPFGQSTTTPVKELPQTEMEQKVARIWQEILGIDGIGLHDNFVDLGGHSLLSMQVIARVKDELGVTISHRAMFMDSLAQIASHIENTETVKTSPSSDKLVSSTIKGSLFSRIKRKLSGN